MSTKPDRQTRLSAGDGVKTASLKDKEEERIARPGSEMMIRRMSDPARIEPWVKERHRIIEYNSRHSEVVQSFRNIRTLLLQQAEPGSFITMVTSIKPGAGTSFVARNLAASIAFDENRTSLLVDCNRDEPAVDGLLNGRVLHGLTDLLEDPESIGIRDVIYSTGIPRLRAVPVGRKRHRPVEYFNSKRMQSFLDVIRKRYDDRYIILDAPAMESSADARILSDWCQYVILVVRYGEVTRDELLEAVATFPREKFVGVVFNDFAIPEGSAPADNARKAAPVRR